MENKEILPSLPENNVLTEKDIWTNIMHKALERYVEHIIDEAFPQIKGYYEK
jgi:hypothetical protein